VALQWALGTMRKQTDNIQLQNGESMKEKNCNELADILGNMFYKADKAGKANVRRHIYEIMTLLENTEKNFNAKQFESKLDLEAGENA